MQLTMIKYPEHTFVLRVPPPQSKLTSTEPVAEIRVLRQSLKCVQPLKELGIQFQVLETVNCRLGYKILRFQASPGDLRKLSKILQKPDIPAMQKETSRNLRGLPGVRNSRRTQAQIETEIAGGTVCA